MLTHLLGQGSFAKVYQAYKIGTKEQFAVKLISKSLMLQMNISKEMIINERNLMFKLNHKNIVKIIEFIVSKNSYYFIFELCSNGDIHQFMKNHAGGKFQEAEARRLIQELSLAFKCMHEQKIVHRDLKLANILLTKKFVPKLCDFGFARVKEDSQIMKSFLGTPVTMAPEVLLGNSYSSSCDLWSIGVIIYQMVFGRYPFQAKVYA